MKTKITITRNIHLPPYHRAAGAPTAVWHGSRSDVDGRGTSYGARLLPPYPTAGMAAGSPIYKGSTAAASPSSLTPSLLLNLEILEIVIIQIKFVRSSYNS
jgi:hypothetical protein